MFSIGINISILPENQMSSLLNTIKKLVYLAPVRCGRTFYEVTIINEEDSIHVEFTLTDKYLLLDPRREGEILMPDQTHLFEKWQHVGLAVGSLRYFLNENLISHDCKNTELGAKIVILDTTEQEYFIGEEKQEKLKHAHRTFNSELAVDETTSNVLTDLIEEFLSTRKGYNITVTDPVIRKKLAALAIYWNPDGDINGYVRPPQMVTAPMMISIPPEQFDIQYWFDMGQLYATIGLTAIERGYQIAYCNAFNLFDPRVARVEDVLHVKYGTYTTENFIHRPWICIGKALDPNKPYNWVGVENRYNDDMMISCILTTKDYVNVIENV